MTQTTTERAQAAIFNDAKLFQDEIDFAQSRNTGLTAWYKSFVSSEDFNKLTEAEKAETFEVFINLKDFLRQTAETLNLLED